MSKFIPRFSLQRYNAPVLKEDLAYPGGGWFCEIVYKEQYLVDKAMCKCPLPVEAESFESTDLFRWTPNGSGMRRNEVFQIGYVANSTD